jgi:hypothetical protein
MKLVHLVHGLVELRRLDFHPGDLLVGFGVCQESHHREGWYRYNPADYGHSARHSRPTCGH